MVRRAPEKAGKAKPRLRTCQPLAGAKQSSVGARTGIDSAPLSLSQRDIRGRPLLVEGSLWIHCVRALEAELPEQQFNTWVRPLQVEESAGVIKLFAPNRFVVDWVNSNLLGRIGELLRNGGTGDRPILAVEVGARTSGNGKGAAAPSAFVATSLPASRPSRAEGHAIGARINPDFTFASFVEGKSNQLAKAAALQVAENPGHAYNPLFLYGGVGLC